jgi:hypothetical protein
MYDDVAVKFWELFYCMTYREPHELIAVTACLCIFHLAPVLISMH